jgi:Protein of unknown function (DUF2844)
MMSPMSDKLLKLLNQSWSRASNRQRMPMLISRSHQLRAGALCSVMLMAAISPGLAFATLGEPEASVQSDVLQLQASIKATTPHTNFRVHEIQMPSGTALREYVSLDGNVFAVAWNGPYMPNLRQALGRYFESFVAGAELTHGDHKHIQVQQPDLVVQARGHMRAFYGRAYLPLALPSGFNLGELQ